MNKLLKSAALVSFVLTSLSASAENPEGNPHGGGGGRGGETNAEESWEAWRGCGEVERATVRSALDYVRIIAVFGAEYMKNTEADAPRANKWFNKGNLDAWQKVDNIRNFVVNAEIQETGTTWDKLGPRYKFRCDCDSFTMNASSNPALLGDIKLCPPFFELPRHGYNSQGGTLIHETSHWFVINANDLLGQGTGGGHWSLNSHASAALLAVNDPWKAANNAFNYEFFFVNTPYIP